MIERVEVSGLQVARPIYDLVTQDVIPGTGVDAGAFWQSFASIIDKFGQQNRELLSKREVLQKKINHWHRQRAGQAIDPPAYKAFLRGIGYLVPQGEDFSITTEKADPEITHQAGPQLVVPLMNARFALNAANARWGSLYDALYGTDVLPETEGAEKTAKYNPARGAKVIQYGKTVLDQAVPLAQGSHHDVIEYKITSGQLQALFINEVSSGLSQPAQFIGFQGPVENPQAIILENNGLHIEIRIERNSMIGAVDSAGVKDILMEAALTTIMDCEDSIAAVDAEDKALVYGNWLGLMKGDLEESLEKDGKMMVRKLDPDREYTTPNGGTLVLPGRSLLFIRNVGLLMTSPAILDARGNEVPEGIMDAMITSLIAIHDIKGNGKYRNSKTGSVYIVKPKMHGPEEVAFTNALFNAVEDALGLDRNTVKVGIMDEERRTSVNLKECIRAASERVVFINTGFLDRTGDEIHTSMEAGPFAPKDQLKAMRWIAAYEDQNVDIGLACGLRGRAQIGKGMWPMPDNMADMMEAKIGHPLAGANTAWVPSPTAATLHALHYHQVDVSARQQALATRSAASVDDILSIPLLEGELTADEIQKELDNNAQGILGYVVRWVEQGVGCSKVPDINNVGLMEDRATLRISSQHIANWLRHGICTEEQVMETMKRMAAIVDGQNSGDTMYHDMAPDFDQSIAFSAACDLVFKGATQPNGYTEPLLHAYRQKAKLQLNQNN